MEALTIRITVYMLMIACIVLGYELRIVVESKHIEKARKKRVMKKAVSIDVYNR